MVVVCERIVEGGCECGKPRDRGSKDRRDLIGGLDLIGEATDDGDCVCVDILEARQGDEGDERDGR